jgi:type IV pilus assembly protein PilA
MKNIIKKIKRNKGFTLIELMIVITIILVMLGFLIPKLYGYQLKAKQTKAINTAKQIQTASMASYGEDNAVFNEADIESTIGSLTDIDDATAAPAAGGQSVDVTFVSDSITYVVGVNAQSSNFTVRDVKDTIEHSIYPKE